MEQYSTLVKEASNLYNTKEYSTSAQKYNEAFSTIEGKAIPNDRYNAACSYALSSNIDTAFYHLFRLAKTASKYKYYNHLKADFNLNSLHKDERWEELLVIVKANKVNAGKYFDEELTMLLDSVSIEDQNCREDLEKIASRYGWDSDEVNFQRKIINRIDSVNLTIVEKIIDERGWLGSDVLEVSGNSALFLVIQHSNQNVQEKYLPIMREAVKNGKARATSLALLEDRVALGQGKEQVYGSQVMNIDGRWYMRRLEDPENVDKRRAEVGLIPLNEYTQNSFGFTWDLEEYYKSIPLLEAKLKSKD
jgi:hypothetical protein